jgi:hypothetical protein
MFTAKIATYKYFLNTLESSKGEESSVSILRNKKLIFGCEHFVPNLDRHEAKQTYGMPAGRTPLLNLRQLMTSRARQLIAPSISTLRHL